MGDANNVFISWSGARSKAAAEALRKWLPIVLQSAKPWMSEADIEKGSRGLEEVGKALEDMKVGIICLTPENLTEPWILYEAGALSKTLDAKTRVCTYLLAGLRKRDVKPPLGLFQATEAERDETRKLVHAVNKALEASPVPESNLNDLFDAMWPQLDKQLTALPAATGAAAPKRSMEDMMAEVLELSRGGANDSAKSKDAINTIGATTQEILARVERARTPWVVGAGGSGGVISTLARPPFDIDFEGTIPLVTTSVKAPGSVSGNVSIGTPIAANSEPHLTKAQRASLEKITQRTYARITAAEHEDKKKRGRVRKRRRRAVPRVLADAQRKTSESKEVDQKKNSGDASE